MSSTVQKDDDRLLEIRSLLSCIDAGASILDLISTCQVRNIRVITDDIYVRLFLGSDQGYITNLVQRSLETLPWSKRVVVDERLIKGVKRTIAVGSGKGGVGKTSVTVALAHALMEQGFTVGILDADVYGPNVATLLCPEDSSVETLDTPEGNRFIPININGLKIMSVGMLASPDQSLAWRGPILTRLLNQFMYDVSWGSLDFLLIDLPPGTGDAQITILQESPVASVLLVGVPGMSSESDLRRTVSLYRKFGLPIMGYVENFSSIHCPNCGATFPFLLDQLDEKTDVFDDLKLLACLPVDPATLSKKSKSVTLLNQINSQQFENLATQCSKLI